MTELSGAQKVSDTWYRWVWFLLRSYKQLNTGKFKVIHEIEKKLPLALYDFEWKILDEGKNRNTYFPFSHIEMIIPWVFGAVYAVLGMLFLTGW